MKRSIILAGKFAASLLMAGVLTMSTVGAALADSPAQQSEVKRGYFGNVAARDEGSFTVDTKSDAEIELAVAQDTRFRVPGMPDASFDDVALGSRVAVLAEEQGDTLTAVKVMVVPGEPQREHRVLTVVEVSGNTVVAEDEQGNEVEVALEGEVKGDLVGQLVTFVGERSQQSNRFKANARVKIGQVVQRMEAQSQRLREQLRDGTEDTDRAQQEQALAHLYERIEAMMQQHLDRFVEIIEQAPEQARPHLEEALEISLKGYRAALEALEIPQEHIEARLGLSTAQGIVSGVDANAGQITLQTRGDTALTLNVTNSTRVTIEDLELDLSYVTPGTVVTVKYQRESADATEIRIKTEAQAQGVIQSVNAENQQVMVGLSNGTTLALTATGQTKLNMQGEDPSINDLPAGARVEVRYNPVTLEALEIKVDARSEAQGTISLVDAESNTLTVLTEDGAELTLEVTDNTRVKIDRTLLGLAGLSEGMAVKVKYDLVTGEALEVQAEGLERQPASAEAEAEATGTVASVDSAAGEVTITLDSGRSITLNIGAETEIEAEGVAEGLLSLADLLGGQRVKVRYDSETRVAPKIETIELGNSADKDPSLLPGVPKVLPFIGVH